MSNVKRKPRRRRTGKARSGRVSGAAKAEMVPKNGDNNEPITAFLETEQACWPTPDSLNDAAAAEEGGRSIEGLPSNDADRRRKPLSRRKIDRDV